MDKEEIDLKNIWDTVLNTQEGVIVLNQILDECGIFENAYKSKSNNQTIFNCGKQSIGQFILDIAKQLNNPRANLLTKIYYND